MLVVRAILLKSKSGTARGKLVEIEKRIFGGDYRSGCMHK